MVDPVGILSGLWGMIESSLSRYFGSSTIWWRSRRASFQDRNYSGKAHFHWFSESYSLNNNDGMSNVLGVCPKYSAMFHMFLLKLLWELFIFDTFKELVANSQRKQTNKQTIMAESYSYRQVKFCNVFPQTVENGNFHCLRNKRV